MSRAAGVAVTCLVLAAFLLLFPSEHCRRRSSYSDDESVVSDAAAFSADTVSGSFSPPLCSEAGTHEMNRHIRKWNDVFSEADEASLLTELSDDASTQKLRPSLSPSRESEHLSTQASAPNDWKQASDSFFSAESRFEEVAHNTYLVRPACVTLNGNSVGLAALCGKKSAQSWVTSQGFSFRNVWYGSEGTMLGMVKAVVHTDAGKLPLLVHLRSHAYRGFNESSVCVSPKVTDVRKHSVDFISSSAPATNSSERGSFPQTGLGGCVGLGLFNASLTRPFERSCSEPAAGRHNGPALLVGTVTGVITSNLNHLFNRLIPVAWLIDRYNVSTVYWPVNKQDELFFKSGGGALMLMQKVPQLLFATSQARLVPVFSGEIQGSTDFCHEAGVLSGHPRWAPSAHLRDKMLQYYARKSPEVFHPFANVMGCLKDERFNAPSLQESRQLKLRSDGLAGDDMTHTLSCGLSTRQAWIYALLSGNREATEALKLLQPGDAVPLNDLPPELLSFRNDSAVFNAETSNTAGERQLTAFEHRVNFNDSTERFTISGKLTEFFMTKGRKVNVVILQREVRRVFTNETMEVLLQTWKSLTAHPIVEGEGGRVLRSFAESVTVSVVKPSGRISEQAALFLQADIVVAASGAGNSWAVFMKPGTVYIEVSPFRMCGALDDGLNRVRNRGLFSGGVFRWAGVNHIATVQRASTELSRRRSGVHAASARVSRARFAVVAQLALLVLANPVTAFVSEFPLRPESAMEGETTVEAAHLKPCD